MKKMWNWIKEHFAHLGKINWHVVLAVGTAIFVILLVVRFYTYGHRITSDDIANIPETAVDNDEDLYFPLLNVEDDDLPPDDGVTTIVAFGNSPFGDDRQSPDNLASLIAKQDDAVVYNCAVNKTYMTSKNPTLMLGDYPLDAFSFYWLTTLATMPDVVNNNYTEAFRQLGDNVPEGARETYDTLSTIDFNTVDVITIMYDGSDYLAGRPLYNGANATDIQYFTGSLEAGIDLLQQTFPHIRIIVMSPTYAFGINAKGEYVSSDIQKYRDYLSSYVLMQGNSAYSKAVTFVDNLYGTITEDNAPEYLIDNLHLNLAGRQLVAKRFSEALHYFD